MTIDFEEVEVDEAVVDAADGWGDGEEAEAVVGGGDAAGHDAEELAEVVVVVDAVDALNAKNEVVGPFAAATGGAAVMVGVDAVVAAAAVEVAEAAEEVEECAAAEGAAAAAAAAVAAEAMVPEVVEQTVDPVTDMDLPDSAGLMAQDDEELHGSVPATTTTVEAAGLADMEDFEAASTVALDNVMTSRQRGRMLLDDRSLPLVPVARNFYWMCGRGLLLLLRLLKLGLEQGRRGRRRAGMLPPKIELLERRQTNILLEGQKFVWRLLIVMRMSGSHAQQLQQLARFDLPKYL
ncbi:hypothetical protein FA15DRAFT_653270 [Coprinopsis marcescibilis]|uniref:Uncharacterized protein n=1 Tax=Coprinopsis marcescibilis TaxID=230819 RepID=A0A5C3L5C7_COPMA|nr:hypothetical protein FA15DRAFT_653270 [Coprinopsis marcescibilis]